MLFRKKTFKNKIIKGVFAGIKFFWGLDCPCETWGSKDYSAKCQRERASGMMVVGDKIRLREKIGEQMPWKIIDRVDFAIIFMKVHSKLTTADIRSIFPKP